MPHHARTLGTSETPDAPRARDDPPNGDGLLSEAEAGAALRVSRATLRRMEKNAQLFKDASSTSMAMAGTASSGRCDDVTEESTGGLRGHAERTRPRAVDIQVEQ